MPATPNPARAQLEAMAKKKGYASYAAMQAAQKRQKYLDSMPSVTVPPKSARTPTPTPTPTPTKSPSNFLESLKKLYPLIGSSSKANEAMKKKPKR